MEEHAELVENWPTLGKAIESGVELLTNTTASPSHDGRETQLLAYILTRNPTNPTDILSTMDKFSLQENFLISVRPKKADIPRDLIAQEKPKVLVKLGGYLGYSSVLFADAMLEAHGGLIDDKGLKVYSLELDPVCAAIARQIAQLAGLEDIIEVIEGVASDSIRNLVEGGKITNIDFLFIDHVEDLYEGDFKAIEALGALKMGAVVVADNVVRPGAPKYREFIRGKKKCGWESSGVKALIWPGDLEVSLFHGVMAGRLVDSEMRLFELCLLEIGRTGSE
ncbi:hypothetical protein EYC80_004634 [Monilinia laxa]|uniref:catechol O-methyltransferase n=1 Tax=Monilinia laxa TaxID=61186 RepID=A0A5N6KHL0_MONLA|nr:hypothetical protein EYC80_004634 [Monilinia laxa]